MVMASLIWCRLESPVIWIEFFLAIQGKSIILRFCLETGYHCCSQAPESLAKAEKESEGKNQAKKVVNRVKRRRMQSAHASQDASLGWRRGKD